MLDQDLSRRVGRLLRGESRPEDLDRLFLALRERGTARPSIREIGDFVAHRSQREKGPVTQRVRDILLSLQSWLRVTVLRQQFTPEEIRFVAEANLRNATDDQLMARLGLKRAVVKSVLAQAFKKLKKGQAATQREERTVDYLGGAFIWNAAFTDAVVLEDLLHDLSQAGLLLRADFAALRGRAEFIALYVVALMHGSTLMLDDGVRAHLRAGIQNDQGILEVKAFVDVPGVATKKVSANVCIFWTALLGKTHCAAALLGESDLWSGPLEIGGNGKLAPLT